MNHWQLLARLILLAMAAGLLAACGSERTLNSDLIPTTTSELAPTITPTLPTLPEAVATAGPTGPTPTPRPTLSLPQREETSVAWITVVAIGNATARVVGPTQTFEAAKAAAATASVEAIVAPTRAAVAATMERADAVEPVLHGNATRKDYEAALAKWQAQQISEYTVAFALKMYGGGYYKSHVQIVDGKPRVIARQRVGSDLNGGPEIIQPDLPQDEVTQTYTLESWLDFVAQMIDSNSLNKWAVEFDPTFGYPTVLATDQGASDGLDKFVVLDFKVLTSGAKPSK